MRKVFIAVTALALAASVAFSAGCQVFHIVAGSGQTIEKTYDFSGFTGISAGWTFNVEVTQGASYSITVTVDDNLEQYLEVGKDGDTLELSMDNAYIYHDTHLRAVITTPRLEEFDLSGASKGKASGFSSADDFRLNVSGASQATISGMSVNRLTADISGASRATADINATGNTAIQVSGASNIKLNGQGVDADIEVSGASTGDLRDYSVRDARVNISGASNATVTAAGVISGEVSGASHLYYTGSPTLGDLDTSGASSVSKK